MLGRHTEGVSHAVKECEHGDDVYRLGDLVLRPACVPQLLHILGGGTMGGVGNEPGVIHEHAFGGTQACFIQLAFQNCRNTLVTGSLNPQEVSVTVESIRTAVEIRDITGDHLLVPALKMALGEMNGIGEVHHLTQEIRP